MKKFLLVLFLAFVVFVVYSRHRLYLRDPLGSVTHDGVKEHGAQVFINYSNDVLLENDNAPVYVAVVQHDNHAGTPAELMCIHWVACLADADVVPLLASLPGVQVETMTNKVVEYRADGRHTVITLR